MTELVLAVRLKADGSGLVGQVRLSEAAINELKAAAAQAGTATEALARDLTQAGSAAQTSAAQIRNVARVQTDVANAGSGAVRSVGQQRAAYQQLGFQIQDITQSIALGTGAFTILAQQGGQTASALDQLGLKGAGGRLVAFLGGPWGAVFIAATAVLGPMIARLFEGGSAADALSDNLAKATNAADSFGNAQNLLGRVIDLTTGKLKTQNRVLIEAIRLQAEAALLAGQADEKKARASIGTIANKTLGQSLALGAAGLADADNPFGPKILPAESRRVAAANAGLATLRDEILDGRLTDATQIRKRVDALAATGQLAGKTTQQVIELKRQLFTLPQALNEQKSARQALDALDGKGIARELVPFQAPKKTKPKSGAPLAQFGESTEDRLRAIVTRVEDLPPAVREAQQGLNQLDSIAREVEQRKPPNYAALQTQIQAARGAIANGLSGDIAKIAEGFDDSGSAVKRAADAAGQLRQIIAFLSAEQRNNPGFAPLIAQAEQARDVVDAAILRPYRDVLASQREQIDQNTLILAGREDEAQALATINALQRGGLALTKEQRDAIVLGIQAIRQQARELETVQRRQQNLIGFLGDARGAIARAFAGESTDIAGDIVTAFRRAFAEQLTQKFVDPLITKLTDDILGRKAASNPIDDFKDAVDATVSPLGELRDAARDAAAALRPAAPLADSASTLGIDGVRGLSLGALTGGLDASDAEVIVTATRKTAKGIETVEGLIGRIVSTGLNLAGIDSKAANKLGEALAPAIKGAATGVAISGLAQSLGIKLDTGGSAIGGGIGGAIGKAFAIPGLDIVGSVFGGLIGNLFKPTPKAKGSAITSVDGRIDVTGTDAKAKDAVAQASRAVQSGIQQIADALGADIGSFSVSIAKYKDSFRVDPTGSGSDGGKYGDRFVAGIGKFDNNDAEGAIAFAIADAIKDGAIAGISPAVAKALQSSADINKALREALKVRDLETLIGGPLGAIRKSIDDFDALAASRVDLARKYGFDLLQVERINAEERAKLLDETLRARVGDLQAFLDQVKFGDLFEGTAAERRSQILAEIALAQQDFDAGVEGAQSRLAELYRTLNQTSRDAFGTAGAEYAADRALTTSGAERNIAAAQAQIDAANRATTDAIMTGNQLTDETNNLLAITNGKLESIAGLLSGGGGFSVAPDPGFYGDLAPDLTLTLRNLGL